MLRFTRRSAVAALSALALTACGQSATTDAETISTPTDTAEASSPDMVLGSADAPVTMVEYASWTCPACLQFDNDVMPMVKSDYIETGKVKLVFREFPTAPENIAVAGFALARCAGPDQYFDVLDELFDRQPGILALVRNGGQVKEALMQVGANHGIETEAAFDACLNDTEIRRSMAAAIATGRDEGVSATPTIFINGAKLEGFDWRTADGMRAVLDEKLSETSPADDAPEEDTPAEDAAAPADAAEGQ
ncbi:MAG: thioredoxin domain-containing protein [Henriciella sp.]|nr:thioredoxin domain-containing protein [Henriciella sp.]